MFVCFIDVNRAAIVTIAYEANTLLERKCALEGRSLSRINPGQERDCVAQSHLPESKDRCRVYKLLSKGENIKANRVWISVSIDLMLALKLFYQTKI
jgi:hypothetical protein